MSRRRDDGLRAIRHSRPRASPARRPSLLLPARRRRRPRPGVRPAHARRRAPGGDRRRVRDPDRRARPVRVARAERRAAWACCVLDGVVAVEVQVGDRTATELTGAGDLLQAPSAARRRAARAPRDAGTSSSRRASPCSTPASPSACARGRRSPWPCCAARASAPSDLDVQRAIACQPRLEVRLALHAVAPRRALGQGRARAASASRSRSPTGCSASSWAPSARRSPTRSRASPRPSSSRGRGDEWHLHGTARAPPRVLRRARGTPVAPDTAAAVRAHGPCVMLHAEFTPGQRRRRAPAGPRGVDDERAGLRRRHRRADGRDQPVARGPADAARSRGRRASSSTTRCWPSRTATSSCAPGTTPSAGGSIPFVLVLEGSVPNEEINGEGHWAGFGVDPDERPADHRPATWIDRLAPAGGRRDGDRHLRGLRRRSRRCATTRPAPWGCATTSGRELDLAPAASRSSTCPAAPSSPTTSPRPCSPLVLQLGGLAPHDRAGRPGPAAVAVRPDRPRDVQPGGLCRGRGRSPTPWATTSAAWSSSGARDLWSSATSRCAAGSTGIGGCPNVGGICIGCTAPGFPDRFMPFPIPTASGWRPRAARVHLRPCARYFRDRRLRTTFEREPVWRRPGTELLTGHEPRW